MKFKSILFLCLIGKLVGAQNENPERQAFTLNLTQEDGNLYTKEIPKSAYLIENKTLEIYPTEKINIEVEVRRDTVYSLNIVKKIAIPQKTITVEFYQDVKKMETWLKIYNPFKKWKLKYDAEVFLLKREKWVVGEVLEIEPQKQAAEVWVNTMSAIRLWNWKLIRT